LTYLSGAIEAPEIKARVVEIREGTEAAFVNRKRKYRSQVMIFTHHRHLIDVARATLGEQGLAIHTL